MPIDWSMFGLTIDVGNMILRFMGMILKSVSFRMLGYFLTLKNTEMWNYIKICYNIIKKEQDNLTI